MITNLGDKIASVATPIARMVGADCIDPETNELRPESPCAQRKRMLNEGLYAEALFSFFRNPKERPSMRFRMSIEVEAETLEEALANKSKGKVLSINPAPVAPAVNPVTLGRPVVPRAKGSGAGIELQTLARGRSDSA